MRPGVLLLDEPTANLDPVSRAKILQASENLRHCDRPCLAALLDDDAAPGGIDGGDLYLQPLDLDRPDAGNDDRLAGHRRSGRAACQSE